MRILVLGQYYWPESFRINEVTDSLLRAGCEVSVLTGAPNYPDGKVFPGYSAAALRVERRGDVRIHRVPVIPRGNSSAVRLVLNYVSFVFSACLFAPWLLRGQRFDVVLVYAPGPILQSIPALLLGRLKRARVITWVQDLWPDSLEVTGFVRHRGLLRLIGWVVRWIYRRNDLLLVQSRAFLEPVKLMAAGTPVLYHPNPGELSVAAAPQGLPALRLNDGFNVMFAGNLGKVQALETVLDAAERTRQHSDVWWVLVGSGSQSEWLSSEVRRRGLQQVMMPGRFAPEAMPLILAQASALLVTLVRSPIMALTVPSKVQAYLAAGRPIIASLDGEGARVVIDAGAGIACPAQDAAALADAVLRLRAQSPEEVRKMGEAGQNFYGQQYDPDILAQRMVAIFSQTLESGPKHHA